MRWDKANLPAYYNITYNNLHVVADMDCLDNCYTHCDCGRVDIIDKYYMCVVHALQNAAAYCVPRKKASFYKFWWDVEASELKYKSIDAHRLWVAAGRPRTGDCFTRMHSAKLQYKLCLRKLRKADAEGISNELNDCLLQKDNDSFWKCWKSKFSSPKTGVHVVDGCTNDSDIAESFADFLVGSAGLILQLRMMYCMISLSPSLIVMLVHSWICLFHYLMLRLVLVS